MESKSGLVLTGLLMDVDFMYDRKVYSPDAVSPTVEALGKPPRIEVIGHLKPACDPDADRQRFRIYSGDGLSPCLQATDYKDPLNIVVRR
jgi:hypothetical protein